MMFLRRCRLHWLFRGWYSKLLLKWVRSKASSYRCAAESHKAVRSSKIDEICFAIVKGTRFTIYGAWVCWNGLL